MVKHEWKIGDRFETTRESIGYKYSRTPQGSTGYIEEVYSTFVVVRFDHYPHLCTFDTNILKPISAAGASSPVAKFKVGDVVETPSMILPGTVVDIDMKAANQYEVDFGAAGYFWMHESELAPSTKAMYASPPKITLPANGNYNVTLPAGFSIVPGPIAPGYWTSSRDHDGSQKPSTTSDELKTKRKLEGRCQECGELLPMSMWGLLDCPQHPSQTNEKQ